MSTEPSAIQQRDIARLWSSHASRGMTRAPITCAMDWVLAIADVGRGGGPAGALGGVHGAPAPDLIEVPEMAARAVDLSHHGSRRMKDHRPPAQRPILDGAEAGRGPRVAAHAAAPTRTASSSRFRIDEQPRAGSEAVTPLLPRRAGSGVPSRLVPALVGAPSRVAEAYGMTAFSVVFHRV